MAGLGRFGCKEYESARHVPVVTWQIRSLRKAFVRVSRRRNLHNLKKLAQHSTVQYGTLHIFQIGSHCPFKQPIAHAFRK